MDNKSKVLVACVIGALAVGGFAVSTNYYNRDDIADDFKATTDGSYFRKHLFVSEDGAKSALDGESSDEFTGGTSNLAPTVGKMQGLWSKADGSNVTAEEFEQHCQQVYGTYWDNYRDSLGVDMQPQWTNPVSVQFDPYKGKFGDDVGLIHYHQNPNGLVWGTFNQNVVKGGYSKIASSGCGPTALSAAFSTMLHRYITPMEIVAARDTMYLRLGQGAGYMHAMWSSGDKGAMVQGSTKVCEFVKNQKYNGQELFDCTLENLVQARVDETLAQGGFIILVPHGSGTGVYWTGGGHYIAIRAKDDQGNYYTVDGSHDSDDATRSKGNHDVPHPWSDLQNCDFTVGAVHYITPGPGYSAYINSLKKSGSTGGSGTSGGGSVGTNQSASTQQILAMSNTEFYQYLTDGKWSSYDEINAVWHSNPNEVRSYFEGNKVSVEVPVWKWADSSKTSKVASTTTIEVHKNMTEFFKDFMTDLHNLPEQYVILSIGGFSVRGKKNQSGSGNISGHSFGCTLDINAYAARGMGSLGAPGNYSSAINTPVEHQSSLNEVEKSECCTLDSSWYKLAVKYQLDWGGNWSDGSKDPMHFSLVGDHEKNGFATTKKGNAWQ